MSWYKKVIQGKALVRTGRLSAKAAGVLTYTLRFEGAVAPRTPLRGGWWWCDNARA